MPATRYTNPKHFSPKPTWSDKLYHCQLAVQDCSQLVGSNHKLCSPAPKDMQMTTRVGMSLQPLLLLRNTYNNSCHKAQSPSPCQDIHTFACFAAENACSPGYQLLLVGERKASNTAWKLCTATAMIHARRTVKITAAIRYVQSLLSSQCSLVYPILQTIQFKLLTVGAEMSSKTAADACCGIIAKGSLGLS